MPHAQPDRTEWQAQRDHLRGKLNGVTAERVGMPRTKWHNLQRLLRAVLWFDGQENGCWVGAAGLAEEADLSLTTLRRTKREALELGLLTVERRDSGGPYGGRLPDLLRVNVESLRDLIESGETPPTEEPVPSDAQPEADRTQSSPVSDCPSARAERATDHGAAASVHGDSYNKEQHRKPTPKTQPPPRQTPSTEEKPPPGGDGPRRTAWAVVEGELFQLGVNQSRAAVRDARAGGLTPAEAHAIVAHWRPRRDAGGPHGPAVLRRRFARARPGEPPHEGWPAYADVHGAQRDDADPATKRAVAEAHRRDAADERRRRAARDARLERYLPLLDDLSREERAALGAEARRRQPDLGGKRGEEVVRQGVLPLLEEWGEAGLAKWRAGRKAASRPAAA
ncbi:MAG: hypothetical protein AAF805_05855 [Planctomycetota bacterium]